MMKVVSVSVIIPCYNCKNFIVETLDSLQKQTFKDFEVICVNDGSTDGTLEHLKEQEIVRPIDIKIVDKENGGVSSARNAGIEASQGKYLLFLDSDDIYNETFIEEIVKSADKYDTVYCKLDRDLEKVYTFCSQTVARTEQNQSEAMQNLLYEMGNYGFYCYLYKREIVEKTGLRFDENTRFFEDREFNWKYLCNCNRILHIDAPLYGYRVNPTSVTQRPSKWQTDGVEAAHRIIRYLQENNCSYAPEVESYLYARVVWSYLKAYSRSRRKDFFKRFIKEYDVKTCMKRTAKDNSTLVKIASRLYLIHPMLFYYAIVCGSKLF